MFGAGVGAEEVVGARGPSCASRAVLVGLPIRVAWMSSFMVTRVGSTLPSASTGNVVALCRCLFLACVVILLPARRENTEWGRRTLSPRAKSQADPGLVPHYVNQRL